MPNSISWPDPTVKDLVEKKIAEAEAQTMLLNSIETKCPVCGDTYSAAMSWVVNKEFCCEQCQNDLKEIVLERRNIRKQITRPVNNCDPGFFTGTPSICDCCGKTVSEDQKTLFGFTADNSWKTVTLCPDCVYENHRDTIAVGTTAFACDNCSGEYYTDQLHVLQNGKLHLCNDCYDEVIQNDIEHMEDPEDDSACAETVHGDELETCYWCKKQFPRKSMIERYDGYWCQKCHRREIDSRPVYTLENRGIITGNTVKHFKGGLYQVLGRAINSEDPSRYNVIYKSLDTNAVWSRDEHMFCEEVERDGKIFFRFEKVN